MNVTGNVTIVTAVGIGECPVLKVKYKFPTAQVKAAALARSLCPGMVAVGQQLEQGV